MCNSYDSKYPNNGLPHCAQINTARERTRFEEEHFYRLPLTKKDRKASRKKLSTVGSIGDEVTSFGANYFSEESGGGSGKKRKRGSGAKGSKKKKKFGK